MHKVDQSRRTMMMAACMLTATACLAGSIWADDVPKITDYFALEAYVNTHSSGGLASRQGEAKDLNKGVLTVSEQLALASSGLNDAMALLAQQMNVESMNSSDMEDRWQYVTSAFFGPARTRLQVAEQMMLEKKQNLSVGKDQRAAMRAFMDDLDQRGKECMVWKRGVVTMKDCMERDIKNFQGKNEQFTKDITEATDVLKKANELLARSDAKIKDVDDQIAKVVIAARTLRTCGARAKDIGDTIKKNYGEKPAELDARVKDVLAEWKAPGDKFSQLSTSLKDYLPKWSANHQKTWDDAMAVRKDFDKAYGPVLSGKLFDGVPSLKGLSYVELDKGARDVQVALTARRMKLQGQAADEAMLQKALDEERVLSAKEKILQIEYDAKWGATAERDMILKCDSINSIDKARKLQLESSRMDPQKGKEYVETEMAKLKAEEDKVRNDWLAGKKLADAEYKRWWAERVKRREKLGLKPDWD